jgi:hypothetical protein
VNRIEKKMNDLIGIGGLIVSNEHRNSRWNFEIEL